MSTTCPTCGADVAADRVTCQVCGTDVSAGAGAADASSAAGPSTPGTPPPGSPPPAGATPPPGSDPGSPSGGWSPPPPGMPGGHGSGPGAALSPEIRNWALAAHLSSFLGAWVALAFVGPLVVWLLKRDEHPFIAEHAKEALNFNLSVLLYGAVAAVASFVLIGLPFLVAILVGWVVLTIVAAVKAGNGETYRYPLTIRFVS